MQRGFTLVELAIVLVIIGLLVGGVLVGQDLIKSAAINATVSDLQSYTAAALTFRDKYNGVPGDLRNDKALQAGLTVSALNPGTTGQGDGDGMIVNGWNTSSYNGGLGGETALFWRHLSDAKLIPFTSTADGTETDTSGFANTGTMQTALAPLLPQLRIRQMGFVQTVGGSGINMYVLASYAAAGSTTNGMLKPTPILSPREAVGIDQKMDDGFPATGVILSRTADGSVIGTAAPANGGSGGTAPSTANSICYDSTTTAGVYATTSSNLADSIRCAINIRTGF